jgi:hypothetical protein
MKANTSGARTSRREASTTIMEAKENKKKEPDARI